MRPGPESTLRWTRWGSRRWEALVDVETDYVLSPEETQTHFKKTYIGQ